MEVRMDENPLIIAMKGHPGTGKSTLAHAIATALRIPLIDKDDVRNCTHPLSTSSSAKQLNDLSYKVIWQLAKTQVDMGLSVVIDSPLSCLTYLDHLKQIAAPAGAHVVIVECVSRDKTKWRQRLEERVSNDVANWHKPHTWYDLMKLLEKYDGCYNYDVGDVPKLAVDTTSQVEIEELVSSVLRFIATNNLNTSISGTTTTTRMSIIHSSLLPKLSICSPSPSTSLVLTFVFSCCMVFSIVRVVSEIRMNE